METWVLGWFLVGMAVVADNRRLRKELRDQKEQLKEQAGTLAERVSALEMDDRRKFVWDTMIRGVLESTN